MMEKVLEKFAKFDKVKAGLSFDFEIYGTVYRVRLEDNLKLKKYVEFVPRFSFVMFLTKGFRDERIEIYRFNDLYLLLHIPRGAMTHLETPFILLERKVKNRWEPMTWLYYHFFIFDAIYLTVRESVEFVVETAIKEDWEIKLSCA